MLLYHRTDIFLSQAQTLVNTVNCVGVMGKGIAAEFKKLYPDMFVKYSQVCKKQLLAPGKLWLWRGEARWILNFPTKDDWRRPSKLEWIESGLIKFVAEYERQGITDISFPRLGCGNGGLEWEKVRPIMEHYLDPLPISVFVHDHQVDIGKPEHLLASSLMHSINSTRSFEDFLNNISKTLSNFEKRSNNLQLDNSSSIFYAKIINKTNLCILVDGENTVFDSDELRSLWLRLNKGILTEKDILNVAGELSNYIAHILGLMTTLKTVQVQRTAEPPEIAFQLRNDDAFVLENHSKTSAKSVH